MAKNGKFSPINPKKYKGDPTQIFWRSSWELKLMSYLDTHPAVLEWSSEELVIPYISPVDGRQHRYFPDFRIKLRMKDGTVMTQIIEVKPYGETQAPLKGNKTPRRYITEVATYGVNQAKWSAAREYCAMKGWHFRVMTEYELGLAKSKKPGNKS